MLQEEGFRRPKVGDLVNAIQKENYASGRLTTGRVKDILTSKPFHPRGIKVKLEGGIVARVQSFVDEVGEQKFVDGDTEGPVVPFDPDYFRHPDSLR